MSDALRLSAPNGDWLELRIARYQFPALSDAPYDSNWLIIDGAASIGGRAWSFRDASLLTYEAAELAAWLAAQAESGEDGGEISFIEPNLSFRRAGSSLRTFLALECAPPWSKAGDDWEAHFVEVPSDAAMLTAASKALYSGLERFPQRADR